MNGKANAVPRFFQPFQFKQLGYLHDLFNTLQIQFIHIYNDNNLEQCWA